MATLNSQSTQNNTAIRILLIEDYEADQKLFEEIVEQAFPNSRIATASNGQEAINILNAQTFSPDIIFLDINMPTMNGHEFLAAYGTTISDKAIPVYVLTSTSFERESVLFTPYTCIVDFCIKSAGYNQVVDALHQCISHNTVNNASKPC